MGYSDSCHYSDRWLKDLETEEERVAQLTFIKYYSEPVYTVKDIAIATKLCSHGGICREDDIKV